MPSSDELMAMKTASNEKPIAELQCIQAVTTTEEDVKAAFRLRGILKTGASKGEKRTVRFSHIEKRKQNPLRKEFWSAAKTSLSTLFKRYLSVDYKAVAGPMLSEISLWVEG